MRLVAGATAVALDAVAKRFGDREVFADLDLTLSAGEVLGVTGANGSGKTTLGRLLLGLEAPDAGAVWRAPGLRCAAVFQEDRLCMHLGALANVRFGAGRGVGAGVGVGRGGGVARGGLADELRAVGIAEDDLHRPVRELSGGQRRRVAIARALAAEANLLVLDEPLTGIDVASQPALVEHIRSRIGGAAVIVIAHESAALALATRSLTLAA